jgi:hypothetical protein
MEKKGRKTSKVVEKINLNTDEQNQHIIYNKWSFTQAKKLKIDEKLQDIQKRAKEEVTCLSGNPYSLTRRLGKKSASATFYC